MASIIDDIRLAFRSGNLVTRMVFVNVGVFLAFTLLNIFGFFFKAELTDTVMSWIAGSSSATTMLWRPWTAITYMFVHVGLWHLVFNMILLWFFGRLFADLLNGQRFVALYFIGGLAGFLLYFVAFNVFPVFAEVKESSQIIGASASVMAIIVAIAAYTPNMEIRLILIGNVKLKYIALFLVLLDVLLLDKGNPGGRLAHLGGAAAGYGYTVSLQKGNDWGKYFYAVVYFFRDLVKPRSPIKVVKNTERKRATAAPTASKKSDSAHQQKIDSILDKISRSGYDSLTKEEKEFLFNASRK